MHNPPGAPTAVGPPMETLSAGATTCTGAVAVMELDDAVMVAPPPLRPVTVPDPSTGATLGAELYHEIAAPVTGRPDASYATALNCRMLPTPTVSVAGEISIDVTVPAGGGV